MAECSSAVKRGGKTPLVKTANRVEKLCVASIQKIVGYSVLKGLPKV